MGYFLRVELCSVMKSVSQICLLLDYLSVFVSLERNAFGVRWMGALAFRIGC